ncbi:hypothetical protein CPT_Maja_014 [Burkholderia phage Maja]|uniref:Uncharacterized protein n=1 Tax=Burkholderia phage Maja TaxID=2767571 RepID=A0A7S6R753_9CAUD|nr:hypothetical protein CPT_Maja_014 [Burkholderia phage Maja]
MQAASVIALTPVPYLRFTERKLNPARQWVTDYAPAVDIPMSVQRVPRNKYVQFNLEFQRNYVRLFAPLEMVDLDRDCGGDIIVWHGRQYKIESQNTWYLQDGWAMALAVDLGIKADNQGKPL